jgi:hypothetical protein
MGTTINSLFQLIGSIASLLSFPLAIYLYLKSKEAKFDRLKKDIVKTLSYQIGDERTLTTFEIETVINSKLRENRIRIDSISVSEVIEDLVSETISSPLINKEKKAQILKELKDIYFKENLFDNINIDKKLHSISSVVNEAKILAEKQKTLADVSEIREKIESSRDRLSNTFALISILITTFVGIFILVGKNIESLNLFIQEKIKSNEISLGLLTGFIISIVAGVLTYLIKKWISKNDRK